jgi:hypothetical protein
MRKDFKFCNNIRVEATRKLRDKKATENNDVLVDVLKILGKAGLRLTMQMMKNIRVCGEWTKDFMAFTMIVMKKKLIATKCSDRLCPKLVIILFSESIFPLLLPNPN